MITGTTIETVADDRTVLLGYIPPEAPSGWILRAIHFLASAEVDADPANYWTMRVGAFTGPTFHTIFEYPLQNGVQTRPKRITVPGKPRIAQGDLVAVRFVSVGSPADLEGLSLVLEYGIFGSRRV